MPTVKGFPPPLVTPCRPCITAPRGAITHLLPLAIKLDQTQFSYLSDGLTRHAICPVLRCIRTGFCVSAIKSPREGGIGLSKMGGFNDDDDEDEDEDGDDEGFIPLRNMKQWFENKPPGFGEGKEYDTSIEDKLLEEIEQSRQAQLANINKLKSNPEAGKPNSKKKILQEQRAPEVVPSGIRVRLVNLPKKRNIHRDLQLAFKGVPGMVNIIPAASGNKKTRDPICKGFAFIDFKSEEDARRFVQIFSGESIRFGKIQKQIRCEILNSKSSASACEWTEDGSYCAQQAVSHLEESSDSDSDNNSSFSDSWELIASDKSEGADDGECLTAQLEDVSENLGSVSLSEAESFMDNRLGERTGYGSKLLYPKRQEQVLANKKEVEAKRRRMKAPKSNIPGSANRLKIREKAVLTGVLSKYAAQSSSASNGHR
ncbi:hypothetical protein NMG60_11008967 [Bertholletia excelsa]